jgi:hypothetical protein
MDRNMVQPGTAYNKKRKSNWQQLKKECGGKKNM